jgi:hypothetical protein
MALGSSCRQLHGFHAIRAHRDGHRKKWHDQIDARFNPGSDMAPRQASIKGSLLRQAGCCRAAMRSSTVLAHAGFNPSKNKRLGAAAPRGLGALTGKRLGECVERLKF